MTNSHLPLIHENWIFNMFAEKQKHKMRWVLFWIFCIAFAILFIATFCSIFFNFGKPTTEERNILFRVFIAEIGTAIITLFYSMFGLHIEKKGIIVIPESFFMKFSLSVCMIFFSSVEVSSARVF